MTPAKKTSTIAGTVAAVAIAATIAFRSTQPPAPVPTTSPTTTVTHVPPQTPPVRVVPTLPPLARPPTLPTLPTLPTPGRPRPSRPPDCNADDIARSASYSKQPGYEYLAQRCGIIHQWKADPAGGDIVVWLAEHGYDSPAADCDYSVEMMWQPGDVRWPLLLLTYHGREYEQPVDVTIESHPQIITFRVPCYADRATTSVTFKSGARSTKCMYVDADPAKGRVWDPVDGKCGDPPLAPTPTPTRARVHP